MTDLEFSDPPEVERGGPTGRSQIPAILAQLRNHPGRWARLPGAHTSPTKGRVESGVYAGTEAGEFEARSRTDAVATAEAGQPRYGVWVRYVGGDDQ